MKTAKYKYVSVILLHKDDKVLFSLKTLSNDNSGGTKLASIVPTG